MLKTSVSVDGVVEEVPEMMSDLEQPAAKKVASRVKNITLFIGKVIKIHF